MAERVLGTRQGLESINKMKSIIEGGLIEQIEALNREGMTLSQPDVWDGDLAIKFRGDWQQTNADLRKVAAQLEEFRRQIQTISENIMRAGGNM